jgi:hypothetical protein
MSLILNGTDGSVSTPAVQGGTGGATTGVYYPASNQVALATNSTLALIVDSSQNVGIGVSNPASFSKLTINGGLATLANGSMGVYNSDNTNFFYLNNVGSSGANNAVLTFSCTNVGEVVRFNRLGTVILKGGSTSADGVGIAFPATQSASSDANTLDDYEEGTFTPSLYDGSTSVSMGTCTYTKIGNLVTIHSNAYALNVSSLGVNSSLLIINLPFAKQTNFNFFQLLISQYSGSNNVTCGDGGSTSTNLYIPNSAQDYDFFTRAKWGSTASMTLRFTMTYRTT